MTAPAPRVPYSASGTAEWRRLPERGSRLLLRWMAQVSLLIGRPAGRIILHGIAVYFFLFAPTARRHMHTYLRRALGREPRAADHYRLVLNFATTIHDRLYLLAERYDLFDIRILGEDLIREVVDSGQGVFLMGAHVGSFEVLRTVGLLQPRLQVVMAMYEEGAARLNALIETAAPKQPPEIIALGHLQAMLQIGSRLDQGACVGMLADRTLGEEAALAVTFLGAIAHLPIGPMRAAAALRRRVVFMLGPYRGGNRYDVIFAPLADFTQTPRAQIRAAIESAVARYAALLEEYCRSDPYNWFNFYDFWRTTTRPAPSPPA